LEGEGEQGGRAGRAINEHPPHPDDFPDLFCHLSDYYPTMLYLVFTVRADVLVEGQILLHMFEQKNSNQHIPQPP